MRKRVDGWGIFLACLCALLTVVLVVGSARAQWNPYAGIWYQTGRQLTINPDRNGLYDWSSFDRIESWADSGDKVAKYGQAYKRGEAPVWSGVFETQCINTVNNCWGTETSIGVNGPTSSSGTRIGVGVVVNRSNRSLPGVADYGIWVLPFFVDTGKVSVRYGVRVDVPCIVACFSMPSGGTIQFSDDPAVGKLAFDPATGYTGYFRGGVLLHGFNNSTGEIAAPVVPCPITAPARECIRVSGGYSPVYR